MAILSHSLSIMLAILCFAIVYLRTKKYKIVTLVDWSILAFGGIYGFGWPFVLQATQNGKNKIWEDAILNKDFFYPFHSVFALITLIGILAGWKLIGKIDNAKITKPISQEKNIDGRLEIAAWILTASAIISQWFYTRAYGGYLEILPYGYLIRSGIFEVSNKFSFLMPFGGLAIIASLIFYGLLLDRKNFRLKFAFIGSLLFSIYILASWYSRVGYLVYLFSFLLSAFSRRKLPAHKVIVLSGIIFASIIPLTFIYSIIFNVKSTESLLPFIAKEISFPFAGFLSQISNGEHLFRLFKDFIVAPLYFLPSSYWIEYVDDVGLLHTKTVLGAEKGAYDVLGSVPIDLITLGLMQASWLGVIVTGMLWGGLLRILQILINKISNKNVRDTILAYAAIKIAIQGMFYSQPNLIIIANFGFIFSGIFIAITLQTPKIHIRNHQKHTLPRATLRSTTNQKIS